MALGAVGQQPNTHQTTHGRWTHEPHTVFVPLNAQNAATETRIALRAIIAKPLNIFNGLSFGIQQRAIQ